MYKFNQRKLRQWVALGRDAWSMDANSKWTLNFKAISSALGFNVVEEATSEYVFKVTQGPVWHRQTTLHLNTNTVDLNWAFLLGLSYILAEKSWFKRDLVYVKKHSVWKSNQKDFDYSVLYRVAAYLVFPSAWLMELYSQAQQDKQQFWIALQNVAKNIRLPQHVWEHVWRSFMASKEKVAYPGYVSKRQVPQEEFDTLDILFDIAKTATALHFPF